jgi:hypothetical protein
MTDWLTRSTRLGRLRDCAAGSAATELALTAPLMVLIAFGAYDHGGAFVEGIRLTSAARAGAQQALYGAADWNDATIAREVALEEYVGHALSADEMDALDVSAVADGFCGCSDGATLACSSSCPGGDDPGRFVRVTLSKSVPLLLPYPWSVDGALDLTREAVVRGR